MATLNLTIEAYKKDDHTEINQKIAKLETEMSEVKQFIEKVRAL
jgi:hypothetical protein